MSSFDGSDCFSKSLVSHIGKLRLRGMTSLTQSVMEYSFNYVKGCNIYAAEYYFKYVKGCNICCAVFD